MYFLIQVPAVMEDEGRYVLVGGPYPSYNVADTARAKKIADSKGWFRPSSFMIVHDATTINNEGTDNG